MALPFNTRAFAASPVALALWLVLTPGIVRAQKVSADKKGNVYYTDAGGKRTRLTNEGKDSDPCLNPAGRRIVYVHAVPGKSISAGPGDASPTELRLMDTDGKNQETLVRSADAEEVENILADFASPTWSPDGNTIYFSSAAYATSGAIHAYDLTKKTVRFVMAGNNPQVVPDGEYKGDLLVEQHRYFLGGGSYDWYWLFKPDGKEVGPVGETTENFLEAYSRPTRH